MVFRRPESRVPEARRQGFSATHRSDKLVHALGDKI